MRVAFDQASALDLGSVILGGVELAPGKAIPSDGDPRIDHALQGLLFTCGPDHIRHPEPVEGGRGAFYPLHGSLAATPVADLSVSEQADGAFVLEGHMDIALADGGAARLHRRWHFAADGTLALGDRLLNIGAEPFAPMMMYHVNLGGALLGEETRIEGAMLEDGAFPWRFGEGESSHVCLPAHASSEQGWASVRLGPLPGLGGAVLQLDFAVDGLAYLQMWRCQRGAANVFALEPVSHRIAKRPVLQDAGEMPMLAPGEAKDFALRLLLLPA
ncbi:DUF4432 domain-containing protein [Xaviernesmea oryzae]|uniref:DUF4432 domain-containing protein n=1 Tax=Xaviernesmea oryzae TaxID=464029 RepID=A0A1Q9AZW8_9HYPH|nr:DUF4432 family protein [Xaviernesmea oryzae]OLP61271.1 DUF4432 domain-containing protein [Xaviernesmea oryzae]SEL52992.1 protein of unknown function [Xaviernesmea oryzae]